jgi:hypothetical protein
MPGEGIFEQYKKVLSVVAFYSVILLEHGPYFGLKKSASICIGKLWKLCFCTLKTTVEALLLLPITHD